MSIQAYQSASVNTMTKSEILLKLYQGLIKTVDMLEEAIVRRDIPGKIDATNRSTAILGELAMALEASREEGGEQGDWQDRLIALYLFLMEEISVSNIRNEERRLKPVREILEVLLETWKDAISQSPSRASSMRPSPVSHAKVPEGRLSVRG
ncbi:MAG: flagellar export chaperone FliS [Nitrospiraceae bacterium]|jgi:flagellar protein FliS|nr:flagellar export chaperone FliS [Nitrospiraceae bacterium]